MRPIWLCPVLLALTAGCHAASVEAPSLAVRPIEARPIPPPDAASEPRTPVDPAIAARLSIIVDDAEEGHRAFEAMHADCARTVDRGAGAAQGSEAWLAAQQALSALDVAKGRVREAAILLDNLRQEPAGFASGNRAAIDAAAARLDTISDAEAAATAALSAKLS